MHSDSQRVHYNFPGTPCVSGLPELRDAATELMKGPPIFLVVDQAKVLLNQFQETANHRSWHLDSVAIMANHIHIVVTVEGDPEPETLLRDLKSYGSRSLNRQSAKPVNGTWWTTGGSKRKLPDENARRAANEYVANQEFSLVIWTADMNIGDSVN
jgi:REP element-mobilizing transposase RayT